MQGWWAASYIVLWLLVLGLCVLVVALARQIGTLHLRLGPRGALEMDDEGPPLGEAPEPAQLVDLNGRRITIGGTNASQLLLFVSPGCHVCEQVLPGIGAAARAGGMSPVVVTDLDLAETESQFRNKRIDAPVVPGKALVREYEVPGTPFAVALDRFGVVRAKGTVNNLEQLEGLADTAKRREQELSLEQTG